MAESASMSAPQDLAPNNYYYVHDHASGSATGTYNQFDNGQQLHPPQYIPQEYQQAGGHDQFMLEDGTLTSMYAQPLQGEGSGAVSHNMHTQSLQEPHEQEESSEGSGTV